jgi:hypothetical protein
MPTKTLRIFSCCLLIAVASLSVAALITSPWRSANEAELKKVIPARAPIVKESIETELRSASGVTDGNDKFIAGATLITAGYSADGKYSHFFLTQVPIKIGEISLAPGNYVLGFKRSGDNSIKVSIYRASDGEALGEIEATRNPKSSRVAPLLISPPTDGTGSIQIGRFAFPYTINT